MELSWSDIEQMRERERVLRHTASLEGWMKPNPEQSKRLTKELYDQQQRDKRDARLKKLGKV